jgi:nucleoside-diphosphate-sugar epimerase
VILALTGGTGFVGSHLLDLALAEGHQVRALTRRPQPPRDGVTWIAGDLADPGALAEGADAVIHVAGVINAPDRAGFAAGNVAGTQRVVEATRAAGVRRFVAVSSLAAREPALSVYGATKAEADAVTVASGLDWTIVRPPAIFGPRDRELLELFRLVRRHVAPLPPAGGRLSLLAVEDLARLLLTLATGDALRHAITEPDDGAPEGWSGPAMIRAIARAMGTWAVPLPLPRALLSGVAAADRALRGDKARLTADRVAYFCHPDWVAHDRPPAAVWTPRLATPAALAATAAWYRANGLL